MKYQRDRKIGFLFTNLSIFLLREDKQFKTSEDYEDWAKQVGESGSVNEMLFYAARAWALQNKQKENFTREGLRQGIALSDHETQSKILNVWKQSQTFGATVKKKAVKKVTR
jgi:hypothetical protein